MSKQKLTDNKKSKKIMIIRILLLVLIVIWAYVVFNFSSQDGEESSGLSRRVVEFFIKDEELVDKIEPYARKAAHFSEYGLGGVLFISLFSTFEWTERKRIIVSSLLGVWYAITDEFHQLMVPERHGSIFDVYIDSLGFITGIFCMLLLMKIVLIVREKRHKVKS